MGRERERERGGGGGFPHALNLELLKILMRGFMEFLIKS